jgi:hypothetical protein
MQLVGLDADQRAIFFVHLREALDQAGCAEVIVSAVEVGYGCEFGAGEVA